jgi:hypothetical protein
MNMKYFTHALLAVGLSTSMSWAGPTWTDPAKAKAENPDFSIQGEYGSADAPKGAEPKWGVQVIADGDGKFTAYVLKGGLPGAGWTGKKPVPTDRKSAKARLKTLPDRWQIKGMTEGDSTKLSGGDYSATIAGGKMTLTAGGKSISLPRIERVSKTMGMKPPAGAVLLYDHTKPKESIKNWQNGKDSPEGFLMQGTKSVKKLMSHRVHIEFRTPYKPKDRGQGRGNSGVYMQGKFETQILDSFGLIGQDNETGGVYSIAYSRVNACFPPLSWQTYDVDFTAAKFEGGKKTKDASMTVHLNGILVHENLALDHATTASAVKDTEAPGPIYLQNHGNPVRFRNIWVLDK